MERNANKRNGTAFSITLPDTTDICPSIEIPEDIMTQFLSSAETALENLESAALELEKRPGEEESLREAKRIIHTIKGETGFLGLGPVADACHDIESHLEGIIQARRSPTDFLLMIKDWLEIFLRNLSRNLAGGEAETAAEPADPDMTPAGGQPLRFLIVEDTPVSQMLLECFLSEFGQCVKADNGRIGQAEFIKALDAGRPFDMVCLDIMMPEMSGQELLIEIRKAEAERGILGLDGVKVIMTTALGDAKNVLGAFRVGCEGYLVKPVAKAKLIAEIRRLGVIA